jgi:hypothetical protein
MAPAYPVTLDIDPAAPQNRLTVLLRIFLMIPHAIILAILAIPAVIITLIAWFVILITGSYPAGMANFVANVLHWGARFSGYSSLLTDKYPPFALGADAAYPIRAGIDPQASGRNRLTVFFRVIMIIPHYVILYFLQLAAQVVVFISWFILLFTGSMPAGLHNFVTGYQRWNLRYTAYALLLTDEYPPFSLN